MCNLRLCTRAQKEIRDLHKLMKDEVKEVDERLMPIKDIITLIDEL